MRNVVLDMSPTSEVLRSLLREQFDQGKKAPQACRAINEFYGREVAKKSTARKWFKLFREGRTSIKHRMGAGRPITVDRRTLRRRLKTDPEASTRKLAEGHCGTMTAWRWLRKRHMKWRRGRGIPHDLTPAQKQNRVDTCRELLRRHRNGRLLRQIITCDESWVYYDGRVRRCQWLRSGQAAKSTPNRDPHGKKRMLCFFWSMQGPVYWELLPKGTTINSTLYCNQLNRVAAAVERMEEEGRRKGPVIFHQDNARPHTSTLTRRHIQEELGWDLLPHPPYSPDIAPSDYHAFRSLKNFLRGRQFKNDEEVENRACQWIDERSGTDFFKRGIRKMPKRWKLVEMNRGDYLFE